MIRSMQTRHDLSGYRSNNLEIDGGAGRIYVTCPTFGVDLSPEYIRASLETESYAGEELLVGAPRRQVGYFSMGHRVRLSLEFDLYSGISLVTPVRKSIGDAYEMATGLAFLVDGSQKPPPPRKPLWLPGGVWNCEYCSSVQVSDLLQCRNCGAPRYAEEGGTCWGNPE